MDWKSKRIRTILEAALAEDKVANDVTTALTICAGTAGFGDDYCTGRLRRVGTGMHSGDSWIFFRRCRLCRWDGSRW